MVNHRFEKSYFKFFWTDIICWQLLSIVWNVEHFKMVNNNIFQLPMYIKDGISRTLRLTLHTEHPHSFLTNYILYGVKNEDEQLNFLHCEVQIKTMNVNKCISAMGINTM